MPVSSNFTALVVREAERQLVLAERERPFVLELWRRLFPRPAAGIAWIVVMLGLAGLAVEQAQLNSQLRSYSEMANFFKAAAPSDPSLLQDFDAIQSLPQDEELLAVLSK